MRFLADENIPTATVRALRSAGHDVFSATEGAPGASDARHFARAVREDRVVLTFDRDFGEMAARATPERIPGVILLRFVPVNADEVTALVLTVLARSEIVWSGHLSVVDRDHVRQRKL